MQAMQPLVHAIPDASALRPCARQRMRRKPTAPPPGGAAPLVLLEEAREIGYQIERHQATIADLAARRRLILTELALSWTQRDIAEEIGLSQPRITQIINGRRGRAHQQEQGPDEMH